MMVAPTVQETIEQLQYIIGTDVGDRGMKSLIVPGDLFKASQNLGQLWDDSCVVILSGFPCCVDFSVPTETDGPPGTMAIARAALALGHRVRVVTDQCNRDVFQAAMKDLQDEYPDQERLSLVTFAPFSSVLGDSARKKLAEECNLLVACERAGPGPFGTCKTMRGIDMNQHGLIAPLHLMVEETQAPFIAIGDGGNDVAMI